MHTIAYFGLPGGWEWMVILAVALLIFGKRLPGIARSFGQSIVEFKKGLRAADENGSSSDSNLLT
ncbi:MAG: twin-arginine translocase TatA/TatE family subunit [Phycisphaerae bacterium]|nr:twin-arginine translocase TatA/TatE family subunit [Phycisphaerae bacterium]